MDPKKCPKCKKTIAINPEEIEELFGYRRIGTTNYAQSWCRKCRNEFNCRGGVIKTLPASLTKLRRLYQAWYPNDKQKRSSGLMRKRLSKKLGIS